MTNSPRLASPLKPTTTLGEQKYCTTPYKMAAPLRTFYSKQRSNSWLIIIDEAKRNETKFCEILRNTVKYCEILRNTAKYCEILRNTVKYEKNGQITTKYAKILKPYHKYSLPWTQCGRQTSQGPFPLRSDFGFHIRSPISNNESFPISILPTTFGRIFCKGVQKLTILARFSIVVYRNRKWLLLIDLYC